MMVQIEQGMEQEDQDEQRKTGEYKSKQYWLGDDEEEGEVDREEGEGCAYENENRRKHASRWG